MPIAHVMTDSTSQPSSQGDGGGDELVFTLIAGPQAPQVIAETSRQLQDLYEYPAPDSAARQEEVWVRAGMIMAVTGSATGQNGLSGSLACPGDRQIFETLRAQADVIVVGAGTARDEDYGPSSTPLAVVSASGNLPPKLQQDRHVLVVCPHDSPAAQSPQLPHKAQTLSVDGCSPHHVCKALAARGYRNILLEGGPHLLATWFASGHVHELCLTLSPFLAGPVTPLVSSQEFSQDAELVHVLQHQNTLFTRWRTATVAK